MKPDRQSSLADTHGLAACPECDLLLQEVLDVPAGDFAGLCPRCGACVYRSRRNGLDSALALVCAALVLLLAGSALPIVGLDLGGQRVETTIIGATGALWHEGMPMVAAWVLLTTVLVPLLQLIVLMWMVLPLRFGRRPPAFTVLCRALQIARPWAMVEVFILGILVALVKLAHLADVLPGAAAWCFGGLMLVLPSLNAVIGERELWSAWESAC